MKQRKLTKKKLEETDCKAHFYSWLKSAEEQYCTEGGIKFNYSNIVKKLKPGLIKSIESKVMARLRREEEAVQYPFGGGPSSIGIYFQFDPPGINTLDPQLADKFKDSEMDKYSHMSTRENLNKEKAIISKFFNLGTEKPNKRARDHLNLLFNLSELEAHIKNVIEEIKKSELRNYADTHETELFQGGVIFKVYRGKEQIDRLRAESATLDFFRKELPELHTPKVYCHGELGDFYVLLEEKIEGITAEQFLKETKSFEKKKSILKNIIENLVDIHLKGKNLDTTYGKIDEKKCLEWFKTGFLDRLKEHDLNLESLIRYYRPVAKQLANYEIKTLNKDANLKNWVIANHSRVYAIDFENTGIRPPQLDLVQLLEDKCLNLRERDKEELKKYYIQQFNKKEDTNLPKIESYKSFNKVYHSALLHRYLINSGFSSEKFKISNPKKCKYLQLKNLNSCLGSLKYLIDNEPAFEEKEQYFGLYSAISNLKKEIRNYKS